MEVEVVYGYEPKEQDELRLCVGDIIKKVVKQETGWYRGTTLAGDTGVFPDNFVKIVQKDGSSSGRTSSSSGGSSNHSPDTNNMNNKRAVATVATANNAAASPVTKRDCPKRECRAVFSYAPQHEDELPLTEGDVLTLLQEVEEGWWKGELRGQIGMFPSNFVEEILHETNSGSARSSNKALDKDGADVRNKNNINANINEGVEVRPKPVTGQGYGVSNADLKKELSRKISSNLAANASKHATAAHNNSITATQNNSSSSPHNNSSSNTGHGTNSGGSVIGINPGNAVAYPGSRILNTTNTSPFQPPGAPKHREGKSPGLYPQLSSHGSMSRADKSKADRDRINSAIEREAGGKNTLEDKNKANTKSSLNSSGRNSSINRRGGPALASDGHATVSLPTASPPQLPPKPVKELARALYPYLAEHEDELSLREGDVITLISKDLEDRGWWKGELNNKVGVFPDNFVQIITTDETPKPPRPDKPPSMGSRGSSSTGTGSPASSTTPTSTSPTPHLNNAGKGAELQQHVNQVPPIIKKVLAPTTSQLGAALTNGHSMVDAAAPSESGERLRHITQQRPRGPNRRPPSSVFKENMRNSSGDSESSSMSIDSPTNSQNFANKELTTPEIVGARISPLPNTGGGGGGSSRESNDATVASKIVSRASQGPVSSNSSSTVSSTSSVASAAATSPSSRPSSMMPGLGMNIASNQSGASIPWLQELNAKQKRKSLLLEQESGVVPTSPAVVAKPSVPNTKKPQQQQSPVTVPQPEPQSNKPKAAKLKPTASTPQLTHPQPFKHPPSPSSQKQQPLPHKPPPAMLHTDVQLRRKVPLDEPDVISSTSPGSRKTSAVSSNSTEAITSATVFGATRVTAKASEVVPESSSSGGASVTDSGSDTASMSLQFKSNVEDKVVVPDVTTTTTAAPAPPSVTPAMSSTVSSHSTPNAITSSHPRIPAPASSSSITTTSTEPITHHSATNNTSVVPSHDIPRKKHSDTTEPIIRRDVPKDIIEDAKALDKVNAILEKLLPKVTALEDSLEEQKQNHARQLQLLMDELDEERKKRACLEIEMERLKKMLVSYTAQV